MAEDIKKTVIIKVDLDIGSYKTQLQQANSGVALLTKEQAKLRKEGKESSAQYAENQLRVAAYRKEVSDLTRVINNATVANDKNTGSNVQLKAALSASTYELNKLSEAEKTTTVRGVALQEQVLSLSDTLKANEGAVGDSHRKIGDYATGLKGLKAELKAAQDEAFAMGQAFGQDSKQFAEATSKAGQLKDSIDDVKAATKAAATGSDLGKFKNQLGEVGDSLANLDFKEAVERAKILSLTVKNFSFSGMISGGKQLIVTLYEVGAAMLSIPIVAIAAGIATIVAGMYAWMKVTQENTQLQVDSLTKVGENYDKLYDRQIKIAKALGKDTEKLELKKLLLSQSVTNKQIQDLEKLEKSEIAHHQTVNLLNDDQKKQLEELRKKHFDTETDILEVRAQSVKKQSDILIKKSEEEKKVENKRVEDSKKADEKILAEKGKKAVEELEMIQKQQNDRIAIMIANTKKGTTTQEEFLKDEQKAQEEADDAMMASFNANMTARIEAFSKESAENAKQIEANKQMAIKGIADLTQQTSNLIFQAQADRIQRTQATEQSALSTRHDSETAALQAQLTSGAITQAQFDQKKLESDQAFADEQLAIKKAAFEQDKQLKKQQLAANLILELSNIAVSAAANPANALTLGAAGISQYAIQAGLAIGRAAIQNSAIDSIKFSKGGVLDGPSHKQGGIPFSINGRTGFEAEGDEIILTKGVSKNPALRQIASQINVAGGGVPLDRNTSKRSFADGGALAAKLSRNVDSCVALTNQQIRINRTLPKSVVTVESIIDATTNHVEVTNSGNI